jgi:hypothetical protein
VLKLRPRERAPICGYYRLLNEFGSPTGERAFVEHGAHVPSAPRAHMWRLEDQTAEDE